MSFFTGNNPCPCESGLDFELCCDNPQNQSGNIIGTIDSTGHCSATLTSEIAQAMTNMALTPELFPVSIDLLQNKCRLIKMSPFWFSESIFLDPSRIIGKCALECDLDWLKQSADKITFQTTPFIFHTAFCGTTLMSRALDLLYNTLPLREPDLLATLLDVCVYSKTTTDEQKLWTKRILNLLSRRMETQQPVVVKANDYANPILSTLLSYNSNLQVIFMYSSLPEFLSGCLKSDNRKQWIIDRYQFVLPHLSAVFPQLDLQQITTANYGKMAAAYWAFNMHYGIKACEKFPSQIKTLSFNAFLAAPLQSIEACAARFNLQKRKNINSLIEITWLMGVYSKDSNYTYSAEVRNSEIKQVLGNHSKELQDAEAMAVQLVDYDAKEFSLECRLG